MADKGTISVSTENIFPIIKKFLYSDHEIFLRELVSNAVDATQKLRRLAQLGEYTGEIGEDKIVVSLNEEAGTITVSDKGIGMTEEEVKKYINQVAFSGASEFVEKYKDEQDIIGKFGLGFYSAFMVANKVQIHSLSHQEGAEAVTWTCEGTTDYEITPAVKKERGTEVVLYVNDDSKEFLEKARIQGILDKYAKFLPVPIEFDGNTVNETAPIWTKAPADLQDDDYNEFYRTLYPFAQEPMFHIHLNVDYPFNLTGVLYFPKIKNDLTVQRDKIQLYSRQVFITDEVKDIVPEFLTLLHGVIDSPDIPLNVSRSYLQSDSNVKKINSYITKKVAEKLQELFKEDRKNFESKWESVGLFVKYGMITDEKFYDRAKPFSLLKNTDGECFTFGEYREKVQAVQTDKDENVVFLYANDTGKQDAYIQSAKRKGYDVLQFDSVLDSHFIGTLEQKLEKVSLKRVDADVADKLIDTGAEMESALTEEQQSKLKEIFKKTVGENAPEPQVAAMAADELPVVITLPEFMRRMQEQAELSGMGGFGAQMPPMRTVTVNANHAMTAKILEAEESQQADLAKQAYDLALLSQNLLTGKDLTDFIRRSAEMIAGN